MDIFQTTVTVIHEISRVTIFIRRVVQEIRSYEDNVSRLQSELEHEFIFLETFKKLFFSGDNFEIRQFKYLPDNLTRSVHNILTGLNKCLAEYRVIALKHGLDLSEAEVATGLEQTTATPSPLVLPIDEKVSEGYRDRFRAMIAALRQKTRAPEWALFSKAKIQALLAQYSEWTERLRQVMMLILLVEGRVGTLTARDIVTQSAGSALGLRKAAARQLRAQSNPPDDFGPLEGSFEALDTLSRPPSSDPSVMQYKYVLGSYTDAFGVSSITAIMEKHTFDIFSPTTTTIKERSDIRTALVRKLAWTLNDGDESSRSPDGIQDDHGTKSPEGSGKNTSHVKLLPCLGYLPIASDGYPSMIYKLPPGTTGGSISTLHDYILNFPRPPLGDRFSMALSLAASVLDVHSSGWVHKGIWSRGILVMPTQRRALYLLGWSTARPRSEEMGMWSMESDTETKDKKSRVPKQLEIELYRHPERYETKTASFTAKHDIYSVGIILLEIALWITMSKQFSEAITKAKEKDALPPARMVNNALARLSRDARVAQEMGEEYSHLIRRCLETDFEVEEYDEKESGLLGQFQALVVDRLSVGAAM
ncbi:hypothetical protein BDV23DRAFT_161567 [Aspergillus alliaceus]|uniref:Protein kinase domain-containing protein n=1 Tax=Petromyces alliaceus TaxID=209559 RepID=A0A5N7BZR5_PETAA|nr:hypothetical protein BDV23DRAFT_161567 [Aspergillus alliaceus]